MEALLDAENESNEEYPKINRAVRNVELPEHASTQTRERSYHSEGIYSIRIDKNTFKSIQNKVDFEQIKVFL